MTEMTVRKMKPRRNFFGGISLQFSSQFAVAEINEHVVQQARLAKFRGDQDVGFAVDVR